MLRVSRGGFLGQLIMSLVDMDNTRVEASGQSFAETALTVEVRRTLRISPFVQAPVLTFTVIETADGVTYCQLEFTYVILNGMSMDFLL
jgi:hypothetical protein